MTASLLRGASRQVTIAADLEHDPRRGRVLFAGELLETILEADA